MSPICLFDDEGREQFLPFTYSRPVAELRLGALTIREKWMERTGEAVQILAPEYLRGKHPLEEERIGILVNARALPDETGMERILGLEKGESLVRDGVLLALRPGEGELKREELLASYDKDGVGGILRAYASEGSEIEMDLVTKKWELFSRNGEFLIADHLLLKEKKKALAPDPSNSLVGDETPFIEEGAKVLNATLNTSEGPIHIAEGAEVMEGSMIRGPFYLGPHGVVKMGAKIYGATSVGPYGKVGGELNNSVIFGYSNKAHDGFLGNSVVGEWCNLGADTNNSNLKNNYGPVRVWDHEEGDHVDTGLTFCGIFMGDHAKCGINTMFNSGTSIGFSANVFGGGFPPKFIPSFYWGGPDGGKEFHLEKAKEVAQRMRARRGLPFDEGEERIFDAVHERTRKERKLSGS